MSRFATVHRDDEAKQLAYALINQGVPFKYDPVPDNTHEFTVALHDAPTLARLVRIYTTQVNSR